MKNFARVMGVRFGSAGAHTYPKKPGKAVPPLAIGVLTHIVRSVEDTFLIAHNENCTIVIATSGAQFVLGA